MPDLKLDRAIQCLVLVRLGQELGSDSQVARAIHALIDLFVGVFR